MISTAGGSARNADSQHGPAPSCTTRARSDREAGRLTPRRLLVAAATTVAVIGVAVAGAWVVVAQRGTTPTVALAPPRYVEETASAGVDHTFGGPNRSLVGVGGGVAAFDCDDDGLPDLYLAGGPSP